MTTRAFSYILLTLLLSTFISCDKQRVGFFRDTPEYFLTDSLSCCAEEFRNLTIDHIAPNTIRIETDRPDLFPFHGILMERNDTIFYRQTESDSFRPYLLLNAPRFDTLNFEYSDERSDYVVTMGNTHNKSGDILRYFQFIPEKRTSPPDFTFVKYIALKRNSGITDFTFSNYFAGDWTVTLGKYPKVIYASDPRFLKKE